MASGRNIIASGELLTVAGVLRRQPEPTVKAPDLFGTVHDTLLTELEFNHQRKATDALAASASQFQGSLF